MPCTYRESTRVVSGYGFASAQLARLPTGRAGAPIALATSGTHALMGLWRPVWWTHTHTTGLPGKFLAMMATLTKTWHCPMAWDLPLWKNHMGMRSSVSGHTSSPDLNLGWLPFCWKTVQGNYLKPKCLVHVYNDGFGMDMDSECPARMGWYINVFGRTNRFPCWLSDLLAQPSCTKLPCSFYTRLTSKH